MIGPERWVQNRVELRVEVKQTMIRGHSSLGRRAGHNAAKPNKLERDPP